MGWKFAHRGLHGESVPENSISAFSYAKEAGYGIELDVHLLCDGNLAVFHDTKLKRITGAEGYIEDLTVTQLPNYYLDGTEQTIPEFSQVLALVNGSIPLIIELKSAGNNYSKLCETVCKYLDNYNGPYCIESFDPRCVYWLKKNRPDVIRGQLAENYFVSDGCELPWYLKFVLSRQLLNFLTVPDFVAYRFQDRKNLGNFICRKLWGAQFITWTLRSDTAIKTAVSEGAIPIFEGFLP